MGIVETSTETEQETAWASGQPENEFGYQSISKAAVASAVFACLGLFSFLSQVFVLLPLLGLCFGVVGFLAIRRYPEELVGKQLAQVSLVASAILLVSSIGWHAYVYATEVPEGYSRISFWQLRDNKKTPLPYSEKAMPLDGQKVFLKGYVRPGSKRTNLKDFIMVGDFGDCCFGGNPDITEIVEINIKSEDTVNHSYSLRKIGGTFRLNKSTKPVDEDDIPRVFYQIEADYVR